MYSLDDLMTWLIVSLLHLLQIAHRHRQDPDFKLTAEEAVAVIKDVFVTAAERDIYTGDSVEIKLIQKGGIKTEIFLLKHD